MAKKITEEEISRRLQVWAECGYSSNKAAKIIGINRRGFDRFLDQYAMTDKKASLGFIEQTNPVIRDVPAKRVKRYLLTCGQNATAVHEGCRRW